MLQSKCTSQADPLPHPVPPPEICLIASLRSPTNFFTNHSVFFSAPTSAKRKNSFSDAPQSKAKRIRSDVPPCDPSDAPSQSAQNVKAAHLNHRDLDSKTLVELRNLLVINNENRRQNDIAIANWHEGDGEDIVILTGIGKLYNERINAITAAITTAPSIAISDVPLWIPPSEEEAEDVRFTRTNAKYTKILRDRLGIPSFRKNQLKAIKNIVERRHDTFVLMPTGAGKSICYQLPAVLKNEESDSVTVVVSPLCSLIDDQVAALAAKGVDAIGLAAETDMRMLKKRLSDGRPNPALVYCTPEKIRRNDSLHCALRDLHRRKKLAMFAVDEAHCITSWGEEFRSTYLELSTLRDDFPGVPIMALTSTATSQNINKITLSLKLQNASIIRQSLNRPNLTYLVKQKRNVIDDLVYFIQSGHANHSGIIYRTGRRQCEDLAEKLNKRGISAKAYHALMPDRKSIHTQWKNGQFNVVVATFSGRAIAWVVDAIGFSTALAFTIVAQFQAYYFDHEAFGFGLAVTLKPPIFDKADVRFVVHYDLPSSLENYYQETGRAGRDGEPADCCLYYTFRNKKTILDLALSSARKAGDYTPNYWMISIEERQQSWTIAKTKGIVVVFCS
ncbi:ATP-dependent DNA helicase hus2/rqh1 [Mycena sanguinolenta]|uniref:DNA 3'-5' helicase n=1 Tax=Mycena sanguinolenta TaxID=230812 RepID=A0A8H6YDG7_9AGAR|nr:ATP-dependent DNA helicase hus2/rqh1 [Mycena sanguinolenta]